MIQLLLKNKEKNPNLILQIRYEGKEVRRLFLLKAAAYSHRDTRKGDAVSAHCALMSRLDETTLYQDMFLMLSRVSTSI